MPAVAAVPGVMASAASVLSATYLPRKRRKRLSLATQWRIAELKASRARLVEQLEEIPRVA